MARACLDDALEIARDKTPRFVSTLGTDRPFSGTLPETGETRESESPLRAGLAWAALLLLVFYVRAIVRAR